MPKFLDTPQWYGSSTSSTILRAWELAGDSGYCLTSNGDGTVKWEDTPISITLRSSGTSSSYSLSHTGDDGDPDVNRSLPTGYTYRLTKATGRPEDQETDIWTAAITSGTTARFTFNGQTQITASVSGTTLNIDCTKYFSSSGYYQTVSSTLPYLTFVFTRTQGNPNYDQIMIDTPGETKGIYQFSIEGNYIKIEDVN